MTNAQGDTYCLRYTNKNVQSINQYYALKRSYKNITYLLNGGKVNEEISAIDVSYAFAYRSFLQHKKAHAAEHWAAYYSCVVAIGALNQKIRS